MCGSTIVNSSPPRTRDRVGFADALAKPSPPPAQHVVTGLVSQRVVDQLEVVEVDDEQRELPRLPLRLRQPAPSWSMKYRRFGSAVSGS
jgi:hypothetical protein